MNPYQVPNVDLPEQNINIFKKKCKRFLENAIFLFWPPWRAALQKEYVIFFFLVGFSGPEFSILSQIPKQIYFIAFFRLFVGKPKILHTPALDVKKWKSENDKWQAVLSLPRMFRMPRFLALLRYPVTSALVLPTQVMCSIDSSPAIIARWKYIGRCPRPFCCRHNSLQFQLPPPPLSPAITAGVSTSTFITDLSLSLCSLCGAVGVCLYKLMRRG